MSKLVELFDKYKCDKGNIKHRYDRVYEPKLEQLNNTPTFNILEIGVFKGSSTQAFHEFCPTANIVALDLYERVDMEKVPALNLPRVTGYRWNSFEKPNNELNEILNQQFDVIIDDGMHTHKAQRLTFLNFYPYLKDGGSYYIEDVWPYDIMTAAEKHHPWLRKHYPDFSEEENKKLMDCISAAGTLQHHDLRKGYDPDTYIIEVVK